MTQAIATAAAIFGLSAAMIVAFVFIKNPGLKRSINALAASFFSLGAGMALAILLVKVVP